MPPGLVLQPSPACRALDPPRGESSARAQVAIKYAEGSLSPGAMSALRFGIAALCFAPNAIRGAKNPGLRRASVELGLYLFGEHTRGLPQPWTREQSCSGLQSWTCPPPCCGLGTDPSLLPAGGYICQAWGLEYTTAGRAAFTFTFTGGALGCRCLPLRCAALG